MAQRYERCRYFPHCAVHLGEKRPYRFSPANLEQMAEDRADGWTFTAIGQWFGTSGDGIRKMLRHAAGNPPAPSVAVSPPRLGDRYARCRFWPRCEVHRGEKPPRWFSPANYAQMAEDRAEGFSVPQIAQRFDTTVYSVRDILHRGRTGRRAAPAGRDGGAL